MNSTRSQKRKRSSKNVVDHVVGRDRLSEMPDEVIVNILSFLPTIYAVRTMLLRRFGNLWTLIPTLCFSLSEFSCALGHNWRVSNGDDFDAFSVFVRNVLMLHRRPTIDKFKLRLEDCYDETINNIDNIKIWLRFALGREVKELDYYALCDDSLEFNPELPAFMSSKSLVKLVLEGCTITPQHQIHLVSLKELQLRDVNVCNEAFQNLISGCPSLQELRIIYPMSMEELRFTAPNIVKLYLNMWDTYCCVLDCPNLKILELDAQGSVPDVIDVSSVAEITINSMPYSGDVGLGDKFIKILSKLAEAETFKLATHASTPFFRLIRSLDLPKNRWKRVVLDVVEFDGDCLIGFSNLARTFGQLEELIIYAVEASMPSWGMLPVYFSSPWSLPKLKTVTMHSYVRPFEGQLQLIEFLLKSGVVLDEFRIVPGKMKLKAVEEVDFLKRVSRFPRSSSNAKVVFT